MPDDVEDYSPERIEYYLSHWDELAAAAEGGTGSLNGSGAGGGKRDRLALACLLADLERAADELPAHWTATMQVFRLQHRGRVWANRRVALEDISLHTAVLRMARQLGWSE